MQGLIDALFNIIKDHREHEDFMTTERVATWISQFDEDDRLFILEETIHILKQRYISKDTGRTHVKNMIEFLKETHKYPSVKELISQSYFINNQAKDKSQSILLEFLEEILINDYETTLNECNERTPKHVIYLDDILCTGDTIIKGLADKNTGWFYLKGIDGESNYDNFKKNNSQLILAYLAVHKRASNKFRGRLYYELEKREIGNIQTVWNKNFVIENDLSENNSAMNFLYPSEDVINEAIDQCKLQIEEKINTKGKNLNKIKYRQPNEPKDETFFSSVENRSRYEKIILEKCITYYGHISDKLRSRPLGYGLNHDVDFGFGTMIFTWRNVPFNAPLIFWYSSNGCTPLFERIFTGNHEIFTLGIEYEI